jgi:DNA-binding CsgD family transcriptional regulator
MIDDFLSFGIAHIDLDGTVRRINKKAQVILDRRDGLYLEQGSIVTDDIKSATFFEHLPNGEGGSVVRDPHFTATRVHRRLNPDPLFIAAFRLPDGCALIIQEPKKLARNSEKIIGAWLELTKREAQLVTLLASARSLEAAANELGITAGTARAHIRHVFAKCRVRSQTELVAMICTSVPAVDFDYALGNDQPARAKIVDDAA